MIRLIGQETAQRALAVAFVNPRLDRICIRGGLGTGKSALLQSLLQDFTKEEAVMIPSHVAVDRLLGALDVSAVSDGNFHFVPGLLAGKKKVVIDMFETMPENTQRLLVQLLKNKEVHVERDKASALHPLDAQWFYGISDEETNAPLLKYAKLCVHLTSLKAVKERAVMLQSARQQHPVDKKQIQRAQAHLKKITVSDEMLRLAVETVQQSGCSDQEADIDVIEAARALAALDGKDHIGLLEIEEAAQYVLVHRMSSTDEPQPASPPSMEEKTERQEETGNQPDINNRPDGFQEQDRMSGENEEKKNARDSRNAQTSEKETVEQVVNKLLIEAERLFSSARQKQENMSGKHRQQSQAEGNGRSVGVKREGADIAFYETFLASAPYAKWRRPRPGLSWTIEKEDLRYKVRKKPRGRSILFVVDASRSMVAKKRMQAVKGAILELLKVAYQKRDRTGLVTFRGSEAEQVLPLTKHFTVAKQQLAALPTGGKTPLAAGLKTALQICKKEKKSGEACMSHLVILTDGNANETLVPGGKAAEARKEAAEFAQQLGRWGVPVSVVDTKEGGSPFDLAKHLADDLNGDYVTLDELTGKRLAASVKN